MLNFNQQVRTMLNQVKEELEKSPFIPFDYPESINEEVWDFQTIDLEIPKTKGNLYFIYDSEKNLLYIGKTKDLSLALLCHLKRRTSKSTSSILDEIKDLVCNGKEKRVYLKIVDVRPYELSNSLKPYLIKELCPSLSLRLS